MPAAAAPAMVITSAASCRSRRQWGASVLMATGVSTSCPPTQASPANAPAHATEPIRSGGGGDAFCPEFVNARQQISALPYGSGCGAGALGSVTFQTSTEFRPDPRAKSPDTPQ
jgi:hypothetical protein